MINFGETILIITIIVPTLLAVPTVLKRNQVEIRSRPKSYPNFVFNCPPGFVRLPMRTNCLRLFRPSRPANFDTASWACSVHPNGNLAHMLTTDEIIAPISTNIDRFWVGIRRWAPNQPFQYIASNYSITENDYRLQSLLAEEQRGDCVYFDTKKQKFALADCRDDVSVDGFMCQAKYELLLFCNSIFTDKSSCCNRKLWNSSFGTDRNDNGSCFRTVYKKGIKFEPEISACAINRTCTAFLEQNKVADKSDSYCTIQCADDYSISSKRHRCDSVLFQSEEDCLCPLERSNGFCFNDNPSTGRCTNYVIVITVLAFIIFLGLVGVIVRQKLVKSSEKRQTRFLETIAMD